MIDQFINFFFDPLFKLDIYEVSIFRIIYFFAAIKAATYIRAKILKVFDQQIVHFLDLEEEFIFRLRNYTKWFWHIISLFILFQFIDINEEIYAKTYGLVAPILNFNFLSLGDFSLNFLLIIQISFVWIAARELNLWLYKYIYQRLNLKYGTDEGTKDSIAKISGYFLFLLWFLIGIQLLSINISVLLGASAVLGIGIGFGLQNLASNFVSGIVILFEKPIKKGDLIEVNGVLGHVADISIRSTFINTRDNISIIVPNSKIISENVTNWSHSDRLARIHIPIGVSYKSDIDLVKHILLVIADEHPSVMKKPSPRVLLDSYGDNSINLYLSIWTQYPEQNVFIKSEINFEIFYFFKKHDIEIPFPQRDIHIKTDEKKNLDL
jgi:small-conductance mechanosensitive channel